jgi:hypothetical protein
LSNGPSDDEIRAYIKDLTTLTAELDVVKAKLMSRRKLAGGIGIELGLLDRRLKRQGWSTEEIKDDWQTELRYAELLGQPIGAQLDAFGDSRTPEAIREKVRWQQIGRMHGLAGRGAPESPPDECPPDARVEYGAGWMAGQEETQAAFLRAQKRPDDVKPS